MEQEKNKVLQVNVVTPDGNVYDHNATIVVAKTVAGEIGILPNHAPIIAPLAIDEVRVRRTDSDTHVDWIAVNGGIMEVRDNVLTIMNVILMCLVLNEQNNVQKREFKKRVKSKIPTN